jgi:hypothetical protein
MRFNQPLALLSSVRVERLYAKHGKAYVHSPPEGVAIELVLINSQRETRVVVGWCERRHGLRTDQVPEGGAWRILGWRMCDQSLPFGEYDLVDPELAQFEFLDGLNPKEYVWPK